MDAVKPIDELNALRRIQQALDVNRNDIGALLELAALQEKDELKRKVLNRILTLDPVNKQAREMLLDMDRARMNVSYSQMAPIVPSSQAPAPASASLANDRLEKVLVSRYSIVPQILVYPFLAFSIPFIFQAFGDWAAFIFFTVCFLLLLIPVWFISAVVRVDRSGIGMSRLFGIYRREIEWREIESINPAVMGVGMRLVSAGGESLTISSQMSRYSSIVDILRQLRPNLFSSPGVSSFDSTGSSGSKTFKKGFFAKYWLLLIVLTSSVIFLGTLATAQIIPALILGIVLYTLWRTALQAVHMVTLEGNRLSTQSFRRKQEVTAQQIRDIRMVTRYNHRGVGTNFIQIQLIDESTIELTRFSEGNEILYGFLKSWWEAYQTG